ncbi:hypothetical protein T440DRAFT_530749 [Plenodomus tracheiphilus IPT5]|uniref:Uncharacterized protein n=1 Tax=Plenodomus tracheiphilus IPT5 TaxID=1408161 RepID=A0A6A7B5I9_9PLEO|nr:hypothetical protein T440DRAFT_530749 [Plenodomus tracheiphilus IPT5]
MMVYLLPYSGKPKTLAMRRERERERAALTAVEERNILGSWKDDSLTTNMAEDAYGLRDDTMSQQEPLSEPDGDDSVPDKELAARPSVSLSHKRTSSSEHFYEDREPVNTPKRARTRAREEETAQTQATEGSQTALEIFNQAVANVSANIEETETSMNNKQTRKSSVTKEKQPSSVLGEHLGGDRAEEGARGSRKASTFQVIKPAVQMIEATDLSINEERFEKISIGIVAERPKQGVTKSGKNIGNTEDTQPEFGFFLGRGQDFGDLVHHLKDWEGRVRLGQIESLNNQHTDEWECTIAIWPETLTLEAEQLRGRIQLQMRQMIQQILQQSCEELNKNLLSNIEPDHFTFGDRDSQHLAQEIWERADRKGSPTALQILQKLRRTLKARGECDIRFSNIMIKINVSGVRIDNIQPRKATDCVAPLVPEILPESDIRAGEQFFAILSSAGIPEASVSANKLASKIERMIDNAPYLLGNRRFTLLAFLVHGEERLRHICINSDIGYPIAEIKEKLDDWVEIIANSSGSRVPVSQARNIFDKLNDRFERLRQQCGSEWGTLSTRHKLI